MCLIKRTEITYSDGRKDTKDSDPMLCAHAANGQPCPRTEVHVTKERSTHSRPSPPSTRSTPTLIHQRDPPRQPRERYYDGSIRIGFNGLRPTYSMIRVPNPTRSLERYEGPSYHDTQAIPPRAPTPPPPHNHDLRLRPTTLPSQIYSVPLNSSSNKTTTTSHSQSYKTIDTSPSTQIPSTTSNHKLKATKAKPRPEPIRTTLTRYAYTPSNIKALYTNTTPTSPSSQISSTSHRIYIPGISRLRSASRHDSACGSSLSPTSPLPSPSIPQTTKPSRKTSRSRSEGKKPTTDLAPGISAGKEMQRFNEKFNYTNDFSSDEDDRGKPPTLRSVARVGERLGDDPEGTARKMRWAEQEARGYQAAGVGGHAFPDEGSVVVEFEGKDGVSGSGRRRRRYRHRHGSHGHRRYDSGSGSGSGSGSVESKRR